MARPATGSVVIDALRPHDPAFGIRFRAAGKRRFATLGRASEGWTESRAEQELADTLALVRKGLWRPPEPPPPAKTLPEETTFHEFASEWFAAREAEGARSEDARGSQVVAVEPSSLLLRRSRAVRDHCARNRSLQGQEDEGATGDRGTACSREGEGRTLRGARALKRIHQPHAPTLGADPRNRGRVRADPVEPGDRPATQAKGDKTRAAMG
jgi:hypothetical protein